MHGQLSVRIVHDGQRNSPRYVEFYSKNKFEKSVHLVGFIIRIYHDERSSECQNERIDLLLQLSNKWRLRG